MSVRQMQLHRLERQIQKQFHSENASTGLKKFFHGFIRWALMLYHEFIRDEVKIRSESLSYLMLFSLLPLIAGAFLIFNFFSNFAYVQDALQNILNQFLSTIPEEHHDVLLEYVMKFKDAYLQSMNNKSSTIGIFALFFLLWVGLSTYRNIDSTLNHIWSADKTRPFYQNMINFLVVSIVAPIVIIAALSLPIVLSKLPGTKSVLEHLKFLSAMLNIVIPALLILSMFTLMYRYIPMRLVRWKSAIFGGLAATVMLLISNIIVQYYFKFGTNTAYGKAAAFPIIFFWIYIVWISLIMGAEVSYLIQNASQILSAKEREPSIFEGQALLIILKELQTAFIKGTGAVPIEKLIEKCGISPDKVKKIAEFLESQNIALECANTDEKYEAVFALARNIEDQSLAEILRKYYESSISIPRHEYEKLWRESVEHWFSFFDKKLL